MLKYNQVEISDKSSEKSAYAASIKKHHETKSKKPLIIAAIIGLVLLIGGAVFLIFALQEDFRLKDFPAVRTLSYKNDYHDDYGNIYYGNLFYCAPVEIESKGEVNTSELGSYKITYTIRYKDHIKTLDQTVEVKDLDPPVIETDLQTANICPSGSVQHFTYKVTDNYDGDITDKAEITKLDNGKVRLSVRDSSGNLAEKIFDTTNESDATPPTITLKGDAEMTILIGNPFNDPGADAFDNCDDEVVVLVDSKVNTSAVGTYEIIYSATDAAGNRAEAKRIVKVTSTVAQPNGNIIYLTFDDGPSQYTAQLLDILKKYNVKATFFVTGAGPDEAIKRAYDEGHAIGLHTYAHYYPHVYQSDAVFMEDIYKIQDRVKNITGYTSTIMRFPGGSSNTVSRNYSKGIMTRLVKTVTEKGFTYFDWNVSSGDAGGATTSDQVYNNVINTLKQGRSIVLQHDTKLFSINAVERIIQYGQSHGYTFARLEPGYWGAHHGVNN